MNRRQFIKIILYLSSLSLAFGNKFVTAEQKRLNASRKIIVIGAGIAGLAAANQLDIMGFQVKVLEARNRIGGRVWTDRSMGFPVDMGASWIHGVNGNPIKKIAEQLNIKTSETDYDNVTIFDYRGTQLSDETLEEIEESYAELLYEVKDYAEKIEKDVSIGHALKQVLSQYSLTQEKTYSLNYALMSAIVEAGAELEELSLWYSDQDEGFSGEDELFPGGYEQIAAFLAKDLDIQLNSIVTSIVHDENGINVTTTNNTYMADLAIVTVPLGVLKSGNIKFIPELPMTKQVAINKLDMGTVNKVALHFPVAFWSNNSEFIGYVSKTAGEYPTFLNMAYHTKYAALLAFTGGNFARNMEKQPDADIKNHIMKILRTVYGKSIPDPGNLVISRWQSDPFSMGSYSHIPVGATGKEYDQLAEPVEHQRLLFAGEATIRDYPGTVHGAYLSGLRESKRIQLMNKK